MSQTTLEHAEATLTHPAIVTRECLMTNPDLWGRLAHLGFSSVLSVESPKNVLAITSDTYGNVHAAGILLMSRHLMSHPETSMPEIHVRAGVEKVVSVTKNGEEAITWDIDGMAVDAAAATLHALEQIAHSRDVWSLKPPLVGVPPSTVGGPIWDVSQRLDIQ